MVLGMMVISRLWTLGRTSLTSTHRLAVQLIY